MIDEEKLKEILDEFDIAGMIQYINKDEFIITEKTKKTLKKHLEQMAKEKDCPNPYVCALILTVMECFEKNSSKRTMNTKQINDYVMVLDGVLKANNINLSQLFKNKNVKIKADDISLDDEWYMK